MTATAFLVLMGPIAAFVGIIVLLDYLGRRQREKAHKP